MLIGKNTLYKPKALDELDEVLTNSSKLAALMGDEFLVYLIDMAVLHVRKEAISVERNAEYQIRKSVPTQVAKSACVRSA